MHNLHGIDAVLRSSQVHQGQCSLHHWRPAPRHAAHFGGLEIVSLDVNTQYGVASRTLIVHA